MNRTSQLQISAQRLQDVLPGARRFRIAHAYGLASLQRADAVGHDAIHRPIATADDVACAGASDLHRVFLKEGTTPRTDGDFRRCFARSEEHTSELQSLR